MTMNYWMASERKFENWKKNREEKNIYKSQQQQQQRQQLQQQQQQQQQPKASMKYKWLK